MVERVILPCRPWGLVSRPRWEIILKSMIESIICLVVLLSLPGVPPVAGASDANLSVAAAEEWSALFDRDSGWVGADGAYSIPLSGSEAYQRGSEGRTLFLFGDTFIGQVKEEGKRQSGTTMVNNTSAILWGSQPEPEKAEFYYHTDDSGKPAALFVPSTPEVGSERWYWPMDGTVLADTLYIFASRIRRSKGDSDAFNFALDGAALLRTDVDNVTDFRTYRQVEAPLYIQSKGDDGDVVFGGAIMVNTKEAGSGNPDGFVYVYGLRNDRFNKKLLAARVRPDKLANFGAWRFWDGESWSKAIRDAAPLTERLSSGFSVSPLADGRFACVFQLDGIGEHVALRIGESPVGPFGPVRKIWKPPELEMDEDIFCYNAKAHPHLSPPGQLLISYNVNSFDFGDHFRNADIYRPRFIRVRLPDRFE